jgi:flagellar assembly factor FliW
MEITTSYHGKIEIPDQDVWTFEKGIPGFPDEQKFAVLPIPDNDIFMILQSVKTSELAFVIANPFAFFKDYEFKIDDQTVEQLRLEKEADALIYSILTVQSPFEKTTANLQAPLILNVKNRQAKQLILSDTTYKTKHSITPATAAKG